MKNTLTSTRHLGWPRRKSNKHLWRWKKPEMALMLLLLMMMMTTVWQTVLPYLFTSSNTCAPLKVKLSYYRLGQVIGIHHSCGFPNFWTIRTWWWEGCQPYAPAAFTSQEISHVLISVRGLVNPRTTVQPEELSEWKTAMTSLGIKPATFQLAAHCLYQLLPVLLYLTDYGC